MYELIRDDKVAEVKALIARDAAVVNKSLSELDETPLHMCAYYDRIAIARLLLEKKATVDVRDRRTFTPFQVAIQAHNYGMARLLYDNLADIDLVDDTKRSRFWYAVFYASDPQLGPQLRKEHINFVTAFLSLNPNCQMPDGGNETVLALVARRSMAKELIKLLLVQGCAIGCDFDSFRIHPAKKAAFKALLKELSAGQVFIYCQHDEWELSENAITTLEGIDRAVDNNVPLNFPVLINTVKKMLQTGLVDADQLADYQALLAKLESCKIMQDAKNNTRIPPLQKLCIKNVASRLFLNTLSHSVLKKLPPQLESEIVEEETQLLRKSHFG